MPQVKVLLCSALLLLAGLLSVSSCANSREQPPCDDCGPCYADRCPQPPPLNGPGGASAFDGTGGLQLNLGSTNEGGGGENSAGGESSGGENSAGGESSGGETGAGGESSGGEAGAGGARP